MNRKIVAIVLFFLGGCYNAQSQTFTQFEGEFVGGFDNADTNSFVVYKSQVNTKEYVTVRNTDQFLTALKKSLDGDFIFLHPEGEFDFTNLAKIKIPRDLTIFSDRGKNKSLGALVFTNSYDTSPLFSTGASNIKIFGIRFRGPDGYIVNSKALANRRADLKKSRPDIKTNGSRFRVYGIPNSNLFEVNHNGFLIENCEIYNWSHAGVYVKQGGDALIKHSYIHHNQRTGLGYGITIDKGNAVILGNLFNFNRHSIAGTGAPGSSYRAEGNIALSDHSSHIFDMHGGRARKDGTDIAGDKIIIRNNLFHVKKYPAVQVRGIPTETCIINDNTIFYLSSDRKVTANDTSLYRQTNGKGRFSVFENKVVQSKR